MERTERVEMLREAGEEQAQAGPEPPSRRRLPSPSPSRLDEEGLSGWRQEAAAARGQRVPEEGTASAPARALRVREALGAWCWNRKRAAGRLSPVWKLRSAEIIGSESLPPALAARLRSSSSSCCFLARAWRSDQVSF